MPTNAKHTGAALAAALLLLAACADDPTRPGGVGEPPSPEALGLVEVTISGIGSEAMRASARPVELSGADGPRRSLTRPGSSGGTGNGSIQMQQLSTGSFTEGTRAGGGSRYVWASFRVRNAQSSGTAYDTPRQNLTLMAVSTSGSLGGTALSAIRRFDGSAAAAGLAPQVVPTGLVGRDADGRVVSMGPDVLQVFTEEEAASLPAVSGVTSVFPYGFVVRNPASASSRTLAASPAADQWDGIVTFAFRVPLQPTAAEDPFTLSLLFLAVDDTETRITQSLEEQTPAARAAFEAQAAAIGAARVTLLTGGAYAGAAQVRRLCAVRTAGTSAAPSAALSPCPGIASVAVAPATLALRMGDTARLSATVTDVLGHPAGWAAVTWSSSDTTVATVDATGRVTARGGGTATVTASAGGASGSAAVEAVLLVPESVTAGNQYTCGLTSAGRAYCWGYNAFGQLGDGTRTSSPVPVAVAGGHAFRQISAGKWHTVAIDTAGRAYAWGYNGSGQLGTASTVASTTPAAVSGNLRFAQVDAGESHTVAITPAGVAYAWGYNGQGRLGDGTTLTRTSPTAVAGGLAFRQASAGREHTVAIAADGTAYGWGKNAYGTLGDGTTVDRHEPTPVAGGLTFAMVRAGGVFTLALTSDGTAYAWGSNSNGSLGDSTIASHTSPHPVSGGLRFKQVSAGFSNALALTPSGAAYGWGPNGGQLGDGTGTMRRVPTATAGALTFRTLGAGDGHTVAVAASGAAYAWGNNTQGQLGDGTTTVRYEPTAVAGGLTFAAP